MKLLVISLTVATVFSLSGCCTAPHRTAWEYRTYLVAAPPVWSGANPLDEGLNKLSAEGWTIQSFSPSPMRSDSLIFLLKRPKQ